MLNEASLLRKYKTQETKKKNNEEDRRIYLEVVKLLNKSLEGRSFSLLDETTPLKGTTHFDELLADKSASAITITFNQQLRDEFEEKKLRHHIINVIQTICFNKDIPINIYLIPDVDSSGNFHYHGVVILPLKFRPIFKKLITKYCGFMKFDYITDNEGWKNYCYKLPPKYTPVYTEEEINKLDVYIFISEHSFKP